MSVLLCSRRASLASGTWKRQLGFLFILIILAGPLLGCASDTSIYATDPEFRYLNSSGQTGGVAGGTLTVYAKPTSPGAQSADINPFVRTGLLGNFSNDRTASFQNLGGTLANGTLTSSRSLTIPVMGGLSVPASRLGLNMPGLTAEIFGGVQVSRRKASLALTEALAPAGPGTSGSSSWTSVDPAVGAALMYYVGNIGTRPVTVGPSVTVDWTKDHHFNVPSASFPAVQLFMLDTGSRAETSVMLNINVGISPTATVGAAGGLTW